MLLSSHKHGHKGWEEWLERTLGRAKAASHERLAGLDSLAFGRLRKPILYLLWPLQRDVGPELGAVAFPRELH